MTRKAYLKRIISTSLIISLIVTLTACSNSKKSAELSTNSNSNKQQQTAPANNTEQSNKTENSNSNTTNSEVVDPTLPKFNKTEVTSNPKFSTPWKTYGTVQACIEGKGETAAEEGIGKVIVKDGSGKVYSYEIADNKKQNSPKYIAWWDDKNLLVVIGLGYGTVSQGGSLYSLNIATGKVSLVYKANDKQNVTAVTKVKNKDGNYDLYIKMLVFEDDNFTKSHYEEFTKPYSELTMFK
ncbi:MAG: hypothetical protein K0R54_2504 [Clostridiaceae bacterium]|jgi:hypothetical protein|nr:hypothetical protein [Clostridiaceae bacterium]